MPTRIDYSIPPPTTWEAFESLCRDLWAEVWNDNNTQKNGRQSQPQHGVDVFGEPKKNEWAGLQAKEKGQLPASNLTVTELKNEVTKAKGFTPKLKKYIVATTGPRDTNVQKEARKITEAHRKVNLFDVTVFSWEDIEALLKKYTKVYKLHYPQHFPDIDAVETLTKKVVEEQKQNFKESSEEISGLKFEVRTGFKHLAEQTSIGGDISQEHQAELDYARDLIDQHKPESALKYIEPIKKRIWNQTNQNVRFRLLTNIAAAKLQLGEDDEAAKLFIEALQYNPDDEKALCNVALANILLKNLHKAKEYVSKVLKKNPANGYAYSMLIQIGADSSKSPDEILKDIPTEFQDLSEVSYGLGTVCRRLQLFSDAEKWFEKLKKGGSTEPEYLVSFATTLLASISKDMHISFSKKLNKAELGKVLEASSLFEQAWIKIKSYEDNSLKIECLVNMGISYLLLGNLEKAAICFDDALVIEPDNVGYVFNRAYIDYESDKKDLALERLKKIYRNPEIPAAILIGDIYLSTKQNLEAIRKEAIPVIEDYLKLNPPLFLKHAAERLLIQIHIVLDELDVASEIVTRLAEQDPKDINTLVSKSRVFRLKKDAKVADEVLEAAEKLVGENSTYFDLLALADELNFVGQYEKAALFYKRVTDSNYDSELTRRLIDCYIKSGNKKEALTICESIRSNQGLVREILQLEVSLHEDIGDLENAEKLCEQYLKENPDDAKVKLHLAAIQYRSQKFDKVDEFLKNTFDFNDLSLRYRIQYSELLSVRGFNKEAINVMYETRRKYFNQSEAHLRYIATLFRTEDRNDQVIHPEKVAANTAVYVETDNGVKTWYLIEDRSDTDPAKNEFTSQHPLAKKLLNKKVGEKVELVSTGPQKKYGKILEIKNKYIYALHNSMTSYQTMFPEAEGLYGIDIKGDEKGKIEEKDLKILFDQIDKQHERYEMVLNLYKEGKLTIGALGKLLGRNPIEAWGLLISSDDHDLKCCIGDVNLRRRAQESLNGNPRIVIDILSLMTIHGLEIADQIVSTFGKLLVSQSTIDVITELISNRKGLFSKGFMTVGKQDGHYVKEEISAEQLNKNTEYLKGIIKWIENNCIIVPCREALSMHADYREKLYELFDESFIDSILIAKQEKALFYSDDERLRSFASGTYELIGLWTQAVIEKLLILGVINNEKYQDAVIRLVNSNYVFTSINADTLIEATKRSQWKADRNFLKICRLLDGSLCDSIPAVVVVSDYFQKLLNQSIYLDDPKNICFSVLDNVIKNRANRQDFVNKLTARIESHKVSNNITVFSSHSMFKPFDNSGIFLYNIVIYW